jgi:hypothetical protein
MYYSDSDSIHEEKLNISMDDNVIESNKEIDDIEPVEATLLEGRNCIHQTDKADIISTQNEVVRTNCLDCNERTNIVQFEISKKILIKQLVAHEVTRDMNVLPALLDGVLNDLWEGSGNKLSRLYVGTNLRAYGYGWLDIAEYMKRLKRLYINNFEDGYYQDCLDFVAGHLQPHEIKFGSNPIFNVCVV